MDILVQLVTALLSGGVVAAVVGVMLHRKAKAIEEELRIQAEARITASHSTRNWQEVCLANVLGPAMMHLKRTRLAFERWKDRNLFLEMKVIGESNRYIRDLILQHGHYIPADLLEHAAALVQHHDAWLEEFEAKRLSEVPDLSTTFIFVGPRGYPFPSAAEAAFIDKFHDLCKQLFGAAAS